MATMMFETLDKDFQRILGPLAERKFQREAEEKEQGFTDLFGRTHKPADKDRSDEQAA